MDAKSLAAKIDAMTLDDMLARAAEQSLDDLPRAGGEYDTKSGWAMRLWGMNGGSGYHKFELLLRQLIKDGLAEEGVPGLAPSAGGWRRAPLIKSAWLAERAC